MAKQEFQLGKWEETALYFMKARADGNEMGYMLKADNPAAEVWWRYFANKGMQKKAEYMAARLREGKEYMVPCQNVTDFDPTYRQPAKPRMPYKDE
jgi:hypothetical protein